MYLVKNV